MKHIKVLALTFLSLMVVACGGGNGNGEDNGNGGGLTDGTEGDMEGYLASGVNEIDQALPQIMILPADETLKHWDCLNQKKLDGRTFLERDYSKYLVDDFHFRRISSFIQDKFIEKSYPLTDFEQSVKSLDNKAASDMADGVAQDAKTMLLQTIHPDIILELNYYTNTASGLNKKEEKKDNPFAHKSNNSNDNKPKKRTVSHVSYTLSAIDAYSNKVVATISKTGMRGESTTNMLQEDMEGKMDGLMNDINKYYRDICTRGREVTVTINVDGGSRLSLDDESIEGDTYADWIIDYMKTHTVKGVHKMQNNTSKELSFVNVRIPLVNADGTQYGVYDWTRDLQKNLRKNLGLQCSNRSQGLGHIVLTVKKL